MKVRRAISLPTGIWVCGSNTLLYNEQLVASCPLTMVGLDLFLIAPTHFCKVVRAQGKPASVALCGKTAVPIGHPARICGLVRKDGGPDRSSRPHLWPCAERRTLPIHPSLHPWAAMDSRGA